ncbi:DegV family protein [Actinomarinicola tropica]|uniref:DegV family EDD domain-containing protein n=1 Tax=Actinomarinicola tropica TaxID=2789776 RepID=A0A5Q2RJ51_9ACTN|nr:DegV family protein [Actinomarinicola tropica]QGG96888.1 DegV family EDD domain-containing protein [Actinomarinicola tropica]
MTVRIVTDSACDLTTAEADDLGIEVVPLTIRFGEDEYVDRTELDVQSFYRTMAEEDALPETAAPAPGAFEAAFRRLADEGADAVVCINLSSKLSATHQSARTAAASLEGQVDVRTIDSNSITAGLGSQVLRAARLARDGAGVDEVVAAVESVVPRTRVYGVLDTLENLRKGGRIGGAQALLGSMLSIKPALDLSSGEVQEAGKPRTRKKALQWLADQVLAHDRVEDLAIMHGEAPDVDLVLDMLADRYPRDEIRVGHIGAVIGTHGGPRVVGACFVVPEAT